MATARKRVLKRLEVREAQCNQVNALVREFCNYVYDEAGYARAFLDLMAFRSAARRMRRGCAPRASPG